MDICSSRRVLLMKATIWRALMGIGMKFHHLAAPKPPRPSFKIEVPSRLSQHGGSFKLVFYTPSTFFSCPDSHRYPVVVNFHGGGFTLGSGTDDARWAATVLSQVDAVFVSVEYRLAPEFPFSVGVEDGTDALIYLASHAEELKLDPHRIALSGFSAGGNFAFTVPLMLYDLQTSAGKRTLQDCPAYTSTHPPPQPNTTFSASSDSLHRSKLRSQISSTSIFKLSDLEPTELEIHQTVPDLTLVAIISFYPPTDFRQTRAEKRLTNPCPQKNLPPILTNLFDESYLPFHPPTIDLTDPYLSPAAAPDALLKAAYPPDIILYTCEFDMLNLEGTAFGERLAGDGIGKNMHGGLIRGVPHAFDKKPNPIRVPEEAGKCYSEACAELKRCFGGSVDLEERTQLGEVRTVERFEGDDVIDGEATEALGRAEEARAAAGAGAGGSKIREGLTRTGSVGGIRIVPPDDDGPFSDGNTMK